MAGERRLPRACAGFTLVEVMAALLLLSLMSVIIVESYRAGLTMWERQHEAARSLDSARVAMQRLRSQIKACYPWTYKERNRSRLYFRGDEHAIECATLGGLTSSGLVGTLHAVRYSLEDGAEGRRLLIQEFPWPNGGLDDARDPILSEAVEGVVDFTLEYRVVTSRSRSRGRGRDQASAVRETRWLDSWEPGEPGGELETLTGVSVSLTVRTGSDSEDELSMLVPVTIDWQAILGAQ